MDLKTGLKIKAKWDGTLCEIVKIEKGIVIYKCFAFENILSSDGLFRDTIEDVIEHFVVF